MQLNILKTTDDIRQLVKTYNTINTVDAVVVLDTSILQPVFLIEYNHNFVNANYAYVEDFNRYYYITNIEVVSGGRMKLYLSIDVLMTYADEIKSVPITVVRNGGIGKPTKMYDNKLPILPNEETVIQTIDENTEFTSNGTNCYVLTVIGGSNVT